MPAISKWNLVLRLSDYQDLVSLIMQIQTAKARPVRLLAKVGPGKVRATCLWKTACPCLGSRPSRTCQLTSPRHPNLPKTNEDDYLRSFLCCNDASNTAKPHP